MVLIKSSGQDEAGTGEPRHIVLKTVCVMYDRQREGGDFEVVSS